MNNMGLKILAVFAFSLLFLICALSSVPRIEKDISSRASAALDSTLLSNVTVAISGRDITLAGMVPTAEKRHSALASAKVYGSRVVNDSLVVVPPVAAAQQNIYHRIYFSLKEFELTDDDIHQLDSLVAFIHDHPQVTVQIHGHTDDQGDPAMNMELSHNRAEQVREYMQKMGIPAKQLDVYYHGQEQPLVANTDEKSRAQNRRVEIILKE